MSDKTDNGWYGVDFDKTLAHDEGFKGVGNYGPPIPAMVEKVKKLLADGKKVKIFTARADNPFDRILIRNYCLRHGLGNLEVTNVKDKEMIELWDDKARQVDPNTGEFILGK